MLIWFRGLGSWVGWVLMMSLLTAVVSECMVDLVLLVPWFGCGFGGGVAWFAGWFGFGIVASSYLLGGVHAG